MEQEIELQKKFYEMLGATPDLSHNTDGVFRGCLFENKKTIDNINETLWQAIKYLARRRERGEKMPATIILNDLIRKTAYIYKTQDVYEEMHGDYFGAASKNNKNMPLIYNTIPYKKICYSNIDERAELINIVKTESFIPYRVDARNIFGLSQEFYRQFKQDKDAFLKGKNAEIRKPFILKDRILPYGKEDNFEFEKIMDCLNPALLQREQGAYYTPPAYVKQMQKMLLQAISEVPKDKDYVIIDRCAGVGNLVESLSDEVLEHCILSTIEYNEYVILKYKFQGKSAVVIPDTDALEYDIIPAEREFLTNRVLNDYVREKVLDDNCVKIIVENPPYSESGSGGTQKTGRKENKWKKSFICKEMKKEVKGVATNELGNLFIWSGFKYYLKNTTDSFIVYSPTKYWRNQELVNKKFRDGFLCNRKEFHAPQNSATGVIWWQNIDERREELPPMTPYDIQNDEPVICIDAGGDITLRKAHHNFTETYDNRTFDNDVRGILCESDGSEYVENGRDVSEKPLYNENIIGYLMVHSFLIDRKNVSLTRCGLYKGHGFYVRSDNFIEKLPLFVTSCFPYDKWWKTDVYSKCYDGQGSFMGDTVFLKKCLFYTALSPKNKCRSLRGSDNRNYRNELCFDGNTLALQRLKELPQTSAREDFLLKLWDGLLAKAKETDEYKEIIRKYPSATLGLWQIMEEINLEEIIGQDRNGKDIKKRKYPSLDWDVKAIDKEIKAYYTDEIISDLKKYELIK
ncbi:MAG: hypothetical protein LBD46_04195 [Endomicrobium sp.]|nr:hypothetical protein [Endomicrobium sp.]